MNTAEKYAIRLTTERGEFWWTGEMNESNRQATGDLPTFTFGWVLDHREAKLYAQLHQATSMAQRLSDGMRTVFAIARVNAVLMRHSTVRGWIPYTDMELEEAFS